MGLKPIAEHREQVMDWLELRKTSAKCGECGHPTSWHGHASAMCYGRDVNRERIYNPAGNEADVNCSCPLFVKDEFADDLNEVRSSLKKRGRVER